MPMKLAVEWPCEACHTFINQNRAYRLVFYEIHDAWFVQRHKQGAYCVWCARSIVQHEDKPRREYDNAP